MADARAATAALWCALASPAAAADRAAPPSVHPAVAWDHPDAEVVVDDPGYRVLYVRYAGAEDVEIHVVMHAALPPASPAVDAASWLWSWETWTWRAWEVDEELDDLGLAVEVWPLSGAAVVEAVGVGVLAVPTASTLHELLFRPRFRRRDVRWHAREARLDLALDDGLAATADRALDAAWWPPGHPWAPPDAGAWRRLHRDDVVAAHRAWVGAPWTVILTGELTAPQRQVLAEALRPPTPGEAPPPTSPARPTGTRLVGVDRPGAPVTAIRLRTAAPPADHPDAVAMSALDLALGQGFASRIHQRLVNELGVAYDVTAALDVGPHAGTWTVATSVGASHSARAVEELLGALDGAADAGLSAAELRGAAATATRQWNEVGASLYDVARFHQELVVDGLDERTARARLLALGQLRAEDTARAASAWLADRVIVVVGDRATLEPALAAAGLDVTWTSG